MPLVAPWNRRKRAERERLGYERPGSVLRGPPISITCECGENRSLRYGEQWTCESCGRRWDTSQIPRAVPGDPQDPASLPRATGALRARHPWPGDAFHPDRQHLSVFILLPLGLMIWFYFVRPVHRRRYRQAIAELPRWELRPQ